MAIARVSVLEFNSPEALENAQRSHKEMRERVFPNLKMGLCVRTGPCSFIDISIYPSIEAAEENLEEREKFHEQAFGSSLKDEFFYQGNIDYFFQTTGFGDLNLKEQFETLGSTKEHTRFDFYDLCENATVTSGGAVRRYSIG